MPTTDVERPPRQKEKDSEASAVLGRTADAGSGAEGWEETARRVSEMGAEAGSEGAKTGTGVTAGPGRKADGDRRCCCHHGREEWKGAAGASGCDGSNWEDGGCTGTKPTSPETAEMAGGVLSVTGKTPPAAGCPRLSKGRGT